MGNLGEGWVSKCFFGLGLKGLILEVVTVGKVKKGGYLILNFLIDGCNKEEWGVRG